MVVILGILLALFVVPDGWGLPVVTGAVAIEVVETVIAMKISQRGAPRAGPDTLVGGMAIVTEPCRPLGRVRVDNEYWQARCTTPADAGERVRILARDRLTLEVEPVGEAPKRE